MLESQTKKSSSNSLSSLSLNCRISTVILYTKSVNIALYLHYLNIWPPLFYSFQPKTFISFFLSFSSSSVTSFASHLSSSLPISQPSSSSLIWNHKPTSPSPSSKITNPQNQFPSLSHNPTNLVFVSSKACHPHILAWLWYGDDNSAI